MQEKPVKNISNVVKTIFTNLLFTIGIILVIFGFIQTTLTITRIVVFEKYPLNVYEENQCDYIKQQSQYYYPLPEEGQQKPLSDDQIESQIADCEIGLNKNRDIKKVNDIVTSITTLVAGSILAFSFKRFIFDK